jgi:hypothetical protein
MTLWRDATRQTPLVITTPEETQRGVASLVGDRSSDPS